MRKFKICKNDNQFKIRYKYPYTLWWCWYDLEDFGNIFSVWATVVFNTIEDAENRIIEEKKKDKLKDASENRTWKCMGEY